MKAIYHQDAATHITLDVLENKDGRVTLGRAKEVLVTGVAVSKDSAPGTCTLIEHAAADKAAADKAAADKAAADKAAADKAAADKAKK